jgi:Flp pilus assembly pilin Flp
MWLFRKLLRDESGQDLAEYGITLALIGLGAGSAAAAMASNLGVVWSTASSAIRMVVLL